MLETQETQVPSLGWEDPLEEGTATHSSVLAWRTPMDTRDWWATVHGVAESQTELRDRVHAQMTAPTFSVVLDLKAVNTGSVLI